jgi:hypothetical protein
MQGLKSAILAIFREGRDGRALLVRPSKIPRWIKEIPFVLGSYELLAMLGGKIRKCPFSRVQFGKITVCIDF